MPPASLDKHDLSAQDVLYALRVELSMLTTGAVAPRLVQHKTPTQWQFEVTIVSYRKDAHIYTRQMF